jgi:hypothetical protein
MYGGKENNAFEEALQTRKVHGFEKGHDFHGRAYGGDVYALAKLVPLSELGDSLNELDPAKPVIVY